MEKEKQYDVSKTSEEMAYKVYIDNHRANVKDAYAAHGTKIGAILGLSIGDMQTLHTLVETHDESKFSKEEFEGYRQYFYPAPGETKDHDAFQKAWEHHYRCNRHHYEGWVVAGVPTLMDPIYVAEMILDWEAMSRNFGGNPLDWYQKNKDKIVLNGATRTAVERVLKAVYQPGSNLKK